MPEMLVRPKEVTKRYEDRLVLDHLDIQSTQIMERALEYFPGAVVVVSHDRFFIDKVATRMLVFVGNGTVRLFEGNWSMREATLQRAVT